MINNTFNDFLNNVIPYLNSYNSIFLNNNIFIFKKGGEIEIKKKNRGSFTRYCGGNVTEECIKRGKNSPNSKIRKKAIFAENVRKFKHCNGGKLVDKLNELLNDLKLK